MARMKKWIQHYILQNPMMVKELRSRMRGRRAFLLLTGYLLVMSGFIWLLYLSYVFSPYSTPDPTELGSVLFGTVLTFQGIFATLIAPSFTVNAITGEREHQSYDLLRTTMLPTSALVVGKLLSGLSFSLLLIFASIPIQSIAFFLGGITMVDLFMTQLLVLVTTIFFSMIGLYFSSRMQRTATANAATYGVVLFLLFGIPIIFIWFEFLNFIPFFDALNDNVEEILGSINFPFALVSVIDGYSSYGLSLGYVYVAIYLVLTAILFLLTVRVLNKN